MLHCGSMVKCQNLLGINISHCCIISFAVSGRLISSESDVLQKKIAKLNRIKLQQFNFERSLSDSGKCERYQCGNVRLVTTTTTTTVVVGDEDTYQRHDEQSSSQLQQLQIHHRRTNTHSNQFNLSIHELVYG